MREDVAVLLEWIGTVVRWETGFIDGTLPIDWRERARPHQIARIREITLPVILMFGRAFAG